MTESQRPELPAPFTTLAGEHRHSAVVDNSEFLAFAARADTPQAALAYLETVRARYPGATHHCWAYQIGNEYRFNDDGEPGGTAGSPMLRAIGGQGLDHVMAVVVRYYGGVKLGTGGLVRAYGGTAAECLRTAPRLEVRPRQTLRVRVPFPHLSALYHLLDTSDVTRGPEEYTVSGVEMAVGLYPEEVRAFTAALADTTRGEGEADVG
ncbi:hypothetical protein GCM10010840_36150 [Deinococcus aerolatus]|uniref:Impact N-terminal domain-containing protein n=1 Tax=Deinococcus aerolatus TaxID=522487 RepID=A0ABQ2GG70_9DEIO|nr:YigZ family protein [Deinococcus aerolatus]GGL94871.1 hypothetical protein GCM10010840_36150 [Deinococcus aerolatus]